MAFRKTLLCALLIALPALQGWCLKDHPVQLRGMGYRTWMAPADAKTWQMERLLYELRQKDETLRTRTLEQLGFERERVGRTLLWPTWIEPITVERQWLSFERRTYAVLTAPYEGNMRHCMVVFVREGDDQTYWKPWQLFEFDTDPAEGLKVSFTDALDDQTKQIAVRHMVRDDVFGNREVVTLLKNDERGGDRQLLPVWQETDEYYRSGKFRGDPWWLTASLKYGNQRIERKVTIKHYTWTKRAEEVRYRETPYDQPSKVETFSERFSWNPMDFSFYDATTELEKLVRHKSPEIRAQAARRLGFLLATTHKQLERAALKDKDEMVRVQAALALASIADPAALPSLRKGLDNTEEDDTVKEALQKAVTACEAAQAAAPAAEPAPAPKPAKKAAKAKGKKAGDLAKVQAETQPRTADRK